jgi:hypothetical protein
MSNPEGLLETNDEPFAYKVTVWSDAQWAEAQSNSIPGYLAVPGYINNPCDLDNSSLTVPQVGENKMQASLVLSGYAKALTEICRTADGLASVWGIDAGFDQLLKNAEIKLRRLQRMAQSK